MRCVEQINQTLYRLLAEDERVLLLGEDILDPYGGAFKATKGLSTAFPDRVLATPISEATIVGVAGGLALEGFRPVVELMFGDFLGLTFDQLLNYVTKYALMFQGGVQCPLVVRTPMGGRRGYGPTHSQSIEKHFVGIPGLEVLALSQVHPIDAMLRYAVLESDGPTLLIENKRLYGAAILPTGRGKIGEHIVVEDGLEDPRGSVVLSLAPEEVPDITIVTYGDSLNEVMQASETLLIEEELVSEIVVLGSLSPLLLDATIRSLRRSGRLLTVEEGAAELSIGSEIVASVVEQFDPRRFRSKPRRITAGSGVVPAGADLELAFLPQASTIIEAALQMRNQNEAE